MGISKITIEPAGDRDVGVVIDDDRTDALWRCLGVLVMMDKEQLEVAEIAIRRIVNLMRMEERACLEGR